MVEFEKNFAKILPKLRHRKRGLILGFGFGKGFGDGGEGADQVIAVFIGDGAELIEEIVGPLAGPGVLGDGLGLGLGLGLWLGLKPALATNRLGARPNSSARHISLRPHAEGRQNRSLQCNSPPSWSASWSPIQPRRYVIRKPRKRRTGILTGPPPRG